MIVYASMGLQEAVKCMRHSKRSILTTDDVNSALSLRNVEVIILRRMMKIYCQIRFRLLCDCG